MGRNILKTSVETASFSIIFQVCCRVINFVINAYVVRRMGADTVGIMNVRLLLIESTLLFLSREAISRAALSATTQHENKPTWPQLINQMWSTVPICAFFSVPVLYFWLNVFTPVDDTHAAQYFFCCLMMVISCIFELTAEAPVFIGQVFCFVKLKVMLDTLHIITRSIIFVVMILYDPNLAIAAFGIAQFVSALTIVVGNYGFFQYYIRRLKEYRSFVAKEGVDKGVAKFGPNYQHMEDFPFNHSLEMIPCVLRDSEPLFNRPLLKLTSSFVKQGFLKQILTEGEKYVMTWSPVFSFAQQATYDVVNNMGSMAARFIFRPVEDTCYFYYTQTISRDIPLKDQPREKVIQATDVLYSTCRGITTLGLVGLTFGQSYAGTLLYLYGGADFVAGGLPETLLRVHCINIVLLAINGITEGYTFATKSSVEIDKYNYFMAIFSIMFLVLSYVFTYYFGPVGFILANICNMAIRIYYSITFILEQYRDIGLRPLWGLIPGKTFITVLIVTGAMCKLSEFFILPHSILYHIFFGAGCGTVAAIAWFFENPAMIQFGVDIYKKKRIKDD